MGDFYVKVGDEVTFAKTVSESDVYLYAGITGDLSFNHVNEAYMESTIYGRRIAHGALMIGFMSTASTMMIDRCGGGMPKDEQPVSLGYDRVRFLGPVFLGDTITVTYTIAEIDTERRRSTSEITITNQRGETVTVAKHILKWVPTAASRTAAASAVGETAAA